MSATVRRALRVLLAALGADVLLVLCAGVSPLGGTGVRGLAVRLLLTTVLLVALPARRRALWLLLLPALLQFHTVSGRLSGDGASYYAQLRSLARDGDIDLANEYEALGLLDRPQLRVPTRTGLRRTVFSVGPALLSLPFFAVGEVLGRGLALLGLSVDLTGYGPVHVNAVALGGLLYGFAAVWLVESTLRRHFAAGTARLAALLLWGATFLHWYMVQQPVMSHTQSAFMAAVFVWQWDRRRPLLRARAIENLAYVVAPAQSGRHNPRRASHGHAMIVDPWGTVLAERYDGEGIVVAELDFDRQDKLRRELPALGHIRLTGLS